MNYRLTDHQSMLHALQRVQGKEGRSAGLPVTVQAVETDAAVGEEIVLRTNAKATEAIVYPFKENLLKIRIQGLDETSYRVKDIVIEPVARHSARVESNVRVSEVLAAPPVDITSSIALYGKTSSIAKTCQMGKMFLINHLNSRGFMVSDCSIGFYYASDNELFQHLEENGKHLFVIDALSKSVHAGPAYYDPVTDLREDRRETFFTSYSRDKVRSHYVYTFRDQVGTVMGYVDLRSTMPGLGQRALSSAESRGRTLALFEEFLFEQCVDLVFQMEMFSVKQWVRIGNSEELLDVSENGRGARLTVRTEAERILRQGSKVRFQLALNGAAHEFTATVRSVKPHEGGLAVGLRIHRGSAENSLPLLAAFARSQMPALAANA